MSDILGDQQVGLALTIGRSQVMDTLKQLAREGHTVVCSIHQPRSSIYAMFDDLVLLSEGALVYSGTCSGIAITSKLVLCGPFILMSCAATFA